MNQFENINNNKKTEGEKDSNKQNLNYDLNVLAEEGERINLEIKEESVWGKSRILSGTVDGQEVKIREMVYAQGLGFSINPVDLVEYEGYIDGKNISKSQAKKLFKKWSKVAVDRGEVERLTPSKSEAELKTIWKRALGNMTEFSSPINILKAIELTHRDKDIEAIRDSLKNNSWDAPARNYLSATLELLEAGFQF